MPCQPCLSDGIWTAWNYLWQKYELFSTFFHYFPKFSTIFSTAQLCFSRSIKAFCRHVSSSQPSAPRPPSYVLHHFVPPLSTLPSSIICRPSLHLPLLLHHIIDHLSSITSSLTSSTTCRPPLRPSLRRPLVVPHFVPPLSTLPSSIICRPSLHRPLLLHHIIDHLSSITSSTTSPPSHHRSFVVHHLSSIICHLSPFPAWTNRVLALYRS